MLTFKQKLPEETGIPTSRIQAFTERLSLRQIPMHSLLLFHRDCLIFEGYYAPCRADTLHRMFSISKSFTAIAVGLLAQEGKLSIDHPIIQYFPEKLPGEVHPWIASLTIKDMLMMRTCHAATTYKRDPSKDWVESFFNTLPTHPAGRLFHYDTSAAHTLCALAEKLSGMEMLAYLKKELAVLGFSESSYMLKDPFGVSMGGSGLVATSLDLLKFGYFIAHKGFVCGRQLLSPSYIEMITSHLTDNCVTAPLPSEAQGYGMQFWRNEKGGFTCYGMGGQLVIFLPDHDLICVTTADTQGIAGGNQQIYDALYQEILPYIENPLAASPACPRKKEEETQNSQKAAGALKEITDSLRLAPLSATYTNHETEERINGQIYHVQDEGTDFQSVSIKFEKIPDSTVGNLSFLYSDKSYELRFGMGFMETGSFPIYGLYYAASGAWLKDGTLYIKAHIIDSCVGSVHFQCSFGEKDLVLFMRKQEETLFGEFNRHLYCTI